jgi:O-antigen ligase
MGFGALAVPALLVVGIGVGTLWIGLDSLVSRVSSSSASAGHEFFTSRGWIWRDTVAMIRANPVTGVGLGAFETAYPRYSKSDGTLLVNYAHNDYLQVAADAGMIGAALAVWFIVLLWRAIAAGLKSRDPLIGGLALGYAGSVVAIGLHSLFDFNLQIPANSLLFLTITAAAGAAAAYSRQTGTANSQVDEAARTVGLSPSGVI